MPIELEAAGEPERDILEQLCRHLPATELCDVGTGAARIAIRNPNIVALVDREALRRRDVGIGQRLGNVVPVYCKMFPGPPLFATASETYTWPFRIERHVIGRIPGVSNTVFAAPQFGPYSVTFWGRHPGQAPRDSRTDRRRCRRYDTNGPTVQTGG